MYALTRRNLWKHTAVAAAVGLWLMIDMLE